MKQNQEFQKIKESIASLQAEIKTSLASPEMASDNNKDVMDKIYRMCDGIYNYIDSVANSLYKHSDSAAHLPPIKSVAQMNKALKALGMDEDYTCAPKTIYASKNQFIIEAEMRK